jgi:thiol:disulfide interchange protein DsbD
MKVVWVMRILFSLLMLIFVVSPAAAQTFERYTQLRVLPERYEVAAGETVTIAIEQVIAPHWHTYWRNPGDSGAPPNFSWILPDGFEVGAVQWPVPSKIPYGPLMNYGYSERAVVLQDLQVPESYDGSPVEIKVAIDILVCEELCIPEYEEISFTLNDGNLADHSALIAEARTDILTLRKDVVATYSVKDDLFSVAVELDQDLVVQDAYMMPAEWGLVENTAKPVFSRKGSALIISQARGARDMAEVDNLEIALVLEMDQGQQFFEVVAKAGAFSGEAQATDTLVNSNEGGAAETPLLIVLLGAFLGGLILNLMPCVFPVLSIKALSLVKIADGHPREARAHGIAYTAGVVLSFLAVAGILMALKFGGAQIGWGFQLQNPIVIGILIYLLFGVALNLFGLFEVKSLAHIGGKAADEGGLKGAFFTGVLATIVATPCTAPFMATAIGVALTQSAAVGLLIFAVIGFGLAAPYLALSFLPVLQRFLPKPGAWMVTFQQFLAFPMVLAVVWLLWVLSQQVQSMQLFSVLLGIVAFAFAVWVLRFKGVLLKLIALCAFLVSFWSVLVLVPTSSVHKAQENTHDFGAVFSQSALEEALTGNKPVFVEMTAAWCITCKLNHAAAINVDATRDLFAAQDVVYLIGDWTNRDDVITRYLEKFGRNGVPLYVFYGAPVDGVRPEPVLLPQLLTPQVVEDYVSGTK